MRRTIEHVSDGTPGVREKLARMRDLVEASKVNPGFRALALDIVRHVPEGDVAGELGAISRWVRKNVTYRRDPYGVELFVEPELLSRQSLDGVAAGDCDDHVMLGAALSEVLGHPSRFRVGGDGKAAPVWSHVWRETWNSALGRWQTFDDTAKKHPIGYSPAGRFGRTMRGGSVPSAPRSPMGACRRVGLPVVGPDGRCVPGLAMLVEVRDPRAELGKLRAKRLRSRITRAHRMAARGGMRGLSMLGDDVPAGVDPYTFELSDGGLGKSFKRKFKRLGKKLTKVVKKALPAVALLANVIPGVGPVVGAAAGAAAAMVKKRAQAKRAASAARAMEAEAAAAAAASPLPQPMPTEQIIPLMPDPYQPSGAAQVMLPALPPQPAQAPMAMPAYVPAPRYQPMPAYESPEPDYGQQWEPPPNPPDEVFEPAWNDGKDASSLDGLWDILQNVVDVGARAATTGTLTVGGTSIPLGRDARRLMAPVQRALPLIAPAVRVGANVFAPTTAAPPPAAVFAPPPGNAARPRGPGTSSRPSGARPTSPARGGTSLPTSEPGFALGVATVAGVLLLVMAGKGRR